MQIQKIYSTTCKSVYFERKLTKEEEQDYKNNVIKPALDYLGVKEFAMILHGSSYPQSENDIKIGTPYGKVAAQLMPFELLHGFNSNQLGPTGELTSKQKISPYESSVGSKNYLFIVENPSRFNSCLPIFKIFPLGVLDNSCNPPASVTNFAEISAPNNKVKLGARYFILFDMKFNKVFFWENNSSIFS